MSYLNTIDVATESGDDSHLSGPIVSFHRSSLPGLTSGQGHTEEHAE